jgi:translation initiation factor IF-3
VRLIDEQGAQLGIVPTRDALQTAEGRGLDLIEVAPNAQPPVCRIMDYGKHKYQQAKREREARKKSKATEVRLMRMKPQIGPHDLGIKLRKLRELLGEGNKVRVSVRFRGREMSKPELGRNLMQRVASDLADIAQVEGFPRQEGRMMSMMVAPKPATRVALRTKQEATKQEATKQEAAKEEAPTDAKEQVKPEPAKEPQPVEERPAQAQDAEDGGEAG